MNITQIIPQLNNELSATNCKLIAVSKTKPADLILTAYEAGQRDFGENKVQELVNKHESLPKDIKWHMIGNLQSNKVKYIAPFIHLIHAVDSEKLLLTINNEAKKNDRVIDCLLQIHIASEESKFGLNELEIRSLLTSDSFRSYENIKVVGLMGMATNTDKKQQIASEFRTLKVLFEDLKRTFSSNNYQLTELSIGMSGDYKIAVEEGSTMVRIGSTIFGAINYP